MSHIVELSQSKIVHLDCLAKAVEHIKGAKLTFTPQVNAAITASAKGTVSVEAGYSVGSITVDGPGRYAGADLRGKGTLKVFQAKIQNGALTLSGDSDHRANIDRVFGKGCSKLVDFYNREVALKTALQSGPIENVQEFEVAGKAVLEYETVNA